MKENVININSEAFDSMKNDFDSVLKKTLENMRSKQSEVAEITMKLKIILEEEEIADFYSENGRRDIVKPIFVHKVGSVMQIKEEKSGTSKGNYEVVYDEQIGDYHIKPIDDGQVTFTEVYTSSEEPQEETWEEADESYTVPQLGSGEQVEEEPYPDVYDEELLGYTDIEEGIFNDD